MGVIHTEKKKGQEEKPNGVSGCVRDQRVAGVPRAAVCSPGSSTALVARGWSFGPALSHLIKDFGGRLRQE